MPQPRENREKLVRLTLPAGLSEWHVDSPLFFKIPTQEALTVSANRLLKFEFPVSRNFSVYERLLKTHLQSPGLSKRTLEEFPSPVLERLYGQLWMQRFPVRDDGANRHLALLLLTEQLMEFNLTALVTQDIRLMSYSAGENLPSYYYEGHLKREALCTVLSRHGYGTAFTEGSPDEALRVGYLADRLLSEPLPWVELLAALDTDTLQKYPRLARLQLMHESLQAQGWYAEALTPQNYRTVLQRLQELLTGPFCALSKATGRARPVRELVIVEGETEKALLPQFAKTLNIDFQELGIYLLPAGGKNQVGSLYLKFAPVLNAPIFVVLDRDAAETARALRDDLRPGDRIFELKEGEIEDTYDLPQILKAINDYYQPYPALTEAGYAELLAECVGLPPMASRVQELRYIWKTLELGAFDKTHFAAKLAQSLQSQPGAQPPQAIEELLNAILEVRRHALADSAG